jgi:hypothetical protein
MKEEHFEALVEYYLGCCQEALDEFSSNVRADTDFLDTEIPKAESISADLVREIGRCVLELQDLNARVQVD